MPAYLKTIVFIGGKEKLLLVFSIHSGKISLPFGKRTGEEMKFAITSKTLEGHLFVCSFVSAAAAVDALSIQFSFTLFGTEHPNKVRASLLFSVCHPIMNWGKKINKKASIINDNANCCGDRQKMFG